MTDSVNPPTRREHDLLGERDVPSSALYGVQTLRAMENFAISGVELCEFPTLIAALAAVKEAAAEANRDLGLLDPGVADAIIQACRELRAGNHHKHFRVDMIQGGAGTSTNMNANEVIANRALELLGICRGSPASSSSPRPIWWRPRPIPESSFNCRVWSSVAR
jgi:aspartate ammonia-lyase